MTAPSSHITHKRLKRKEEIQSKALQMISDSGLEALTMQKLAASLDLTAGALYRYFRSKAELIASLEGQVLRDLSRRLSDALARCKAPRDAADAALFRLWVCARFYLRQTGERPEHANLIAMLLADPRHLVDHKDLPDVSADFIGLFGQLVQELSAAQQCGALKAGDPQRRALVFWSSLQGAASLEKLRRVDADFFDPARAGSDLITTLLQGWGAMPRRVRAQEQRCETHALSTRKQQHQDNQS